MTPLNGCEFSLETPRLTVIPLPPPDFALLLEGVSNLEQARGWQASDECWDAHTREAMSGLYAMQQSAMAERSGEDAVMASNALVWPWYTNWRILWKSENVCVGSACFMGRPDACGVVEIGYGTHAAYRNRGLMTEAVGRMLHWALERPGVSRVVAESELDNIASHRVLEKNGMRLIRQTDTSLFYATISNTPPPTTLRSDNDTTSNVF
ncbi:MAG: GNAT family N-acetyltransferase [Thermoguttaceae bacterium]|nr:GNAT family N-acetyltransferase [Thermoguttaceae bacterium]